MTRLSILSLFGRQSGSFLVPVRTLSAAARSDGQGRPSGRRVSRLALDRREHRCTLAPIEANGFPRRRRSGCALALLLLLVPFGATRAATPLSANVSNASESRDTIAAAVDEAAARFGLPAHWIHAVIAQESGGDQRAVSPKGAMGLLQLMPATWRDMTVELQLGDDPFDPRANILAGAGYLRRMYDRFGAPGFLAAYNAGPARYARTLTDGVDLPPETRRYVARLAPMLFGSTQQTSQRSDWRASALFVASMETQGSDGPARISGVWP